MQEKQRKQLKQERDSIVKEIRETGKDLETLRVNIPAALRGEGLFSAEQLSRLIKEKEKRLEELNSLSSEKTKEYEQLQIKKKDLKSMGTIISDWGDLFMECSIAEKRYCLQN